MKPPQSLITCCFLVIIIHSGEAQTSPFLRFILTPDSITVTHPTPTLGLSMRRSLSASRNEGIAIRGIRGGVRFGAMRHSVQLGYYWYSKNEDVGLIDWENILQIFNSRYFNYVDGRYWGLSYQHFLIQNHRMALGIPVEIGIGKPTPQQISQNEFMAGVKHYFPLQLGIYGEWKAIRYAGLNASVSYRKFLNYNESKNSINGLYWGFGVSVYLGTFSHDMYYFFRKSHPKKPFD